MAYLNTNSSTPHLKLTRSSHNLSNKKYFDVEQGWLIPTAVYDCVPGDRFNLGSSLLIRTTPLIKPAFTNDLQAKTASFFVPYRIIWKDFENFFSGGRNGDKQYPIPVFRLNTLNAKPYTLLDYFDLPNISSNEVVGSLSTRITAFYILAYIKIWNDYFRNPSIDVEVDVYNLKIYTPSYPDGVTFTPVSGDFTYNGVTYKVLDYSIFIYYCLGFMNNYLLPNSNIDPDNWPNITDEEYGELSKPALVNLPRDFFTSALPTYVSGTPVSYDLSGTSGVKFGTNVGITVDSSAGLNPSVGYGIKYTNSSYRLTLGSLNSGSLQSAGVGSVTGSPNVTDTSSGLIASSAALNLSAAVGGGNSFIAGIYPRELRLIFGLDIKNQLRNITGNRYQDLLYAFYGVTTKDYRLNMAEYIGGSRSPIYTSEVLQTSESSSTPLGEQGGHAISSNVGKHGSKFIDEFGCIINLFWINSSNIYAECLRRDWRRFSSDDLFFSSFENLGDQEIFTEELAFSFSSDANNTKIFGFTPRYSEYKYYNDVVCGGFRGNYRYWTQARFFSPDSVSWTSPNLNSIFIKPSIKSNNRIFQTIGNDYTLKPYQVRFDNRTIAYRPMQNNSIGYLIDHF